MLTGQWGDFGLDTRGQQPEKLPMKCVGPFPESQLVMLVNGGTVNLYLEVGLNIAGTGVCSVKL